MEAMICMECAVSTIRKQEDLFLLLFFLVVLLLDELLLTLGGLGVSLLLAWPHSAPLGQLGLGSLGHGFNISVHNTRVVHRDIKPMTKRPKAKLPKWCGVRPGKKEGDPETPEGEEEAVEEEAEEEFDEEEDYEEEEEEE